MLTEVNKKAKCEKNVFFVLFCFVIASFQKLKNKNKNKKQNNTIKKNPCSHIYSVSIQMWGQCDVDQAAHLKYFP